MTTTAVRSRRVVTPDGVRPAAIHISAGQIVRVSDWADAGQPDSRTDFGDLAILPGIVDTHVHLNEPGRTEWEGFATATRAAAIGGVTALVDMPLNSIPPTTTREAFAAKRAAARGQCAVDVGFWGGVVPGNQRELAGLVADGVRGFKCFLVDSGVAEFGWVGEAELAPAMQILAGLGRPLLVHAELAGPIDRATAGLHDADPHRYATYLASRPPAAEEEAIALVTRLCRATRARTHIVHHSAASALQQLRDARAEGLPLSAETCPHYLHFTAESIPDGATPFKCAPPIRDAANREALWAALADGTLELVASDHSPCSPALKAIDPTAPPFGGAAREGALARGTTAPPFGGAAREGALARGGDFIAAWGGVSGLQLALSVVWTEAVRRGHSLSDVARWMSGAPAKLAGLAGQKGAIAPGHDADLVVFADDETQAITSDRVHHRHKVTPYLGETLRGVVHATYLRGELVARSGELVADARGALL